jgi:hypothetical protein
MPEQLIHFRRGSRKMQYLMDQYRASHPDEGPDVWPHLVADWAIENGLWEPLPVSPREQLRRLLSRSLRETYMLDPQGREVRANLPIVEEVVTKDGPKRLSHWFPLFDTPGKVARVSFSLRRRAALADVLQLHFDFMSWNQNNKSGEALDPLDFNFNADITELAQPTTYPDEPEGEQAAEEEEDENY